VSGYRPPKDSEVARVAEWLRDVGAHLAVVAPGLLAAREMAPDMVPAEVHVSGGGRSDPTGSAAVSAADFASGSQLTVTQNTLREYMADAVEVCDSLMRTMTRLGQMTAAAKVSVAGDPDELCRQGCGRAKAKGRGGECERCYHWRYEQGRRDPSGVRPLTIPSPLIQRWRDEDAQGKPARRPAPGHVDHDDPEAA
jgi:hypothetical protein